MGVVVKPLGALTCESCRQGWHMTAAAVDRCKRVSLLTHTFASERTRS